MTLLNDTRIGRFAMMGALAMLVFAAMGCSSAGSFTETRSAPAFSAPVAPRPAAFERPTTARPAGRNTLPASYGSTESTEVCETGGWKEFIDGYRVEPVVGSRSGSARSAAVPVKGR
jgi:hypothetical protein